MQPIRKYIFPLRLSVEQLANFHSSLEAAFVAHDYFHVARFGQENPELHGCALLMLGNRVGGERILDKHDIRTGRSCFYRAYAAWQDDHVDEAKRQLTESKALGYSMPHIKRLEDLIGKQSFRVLCHWDIHGSHYLRAFENLPGIEIMPTRQLPSPGMKLLPFGRPLASWLPPEIIFDLVILDDIKMVPVGISNLGAPVAAVMHDVEWHYELLDRLAPEIDLMSVGSSSEIIEAARPFGIKATGHFFPLHLSLPDKRKFAEELAEPEKRATDLFYSGSIGHDFYRYKKQDVLSLGQLDPRFTVRIEETFYPLDEFWQKMRQSRFSIMSSRAANYVSTRAMESLACGTFHLIEEENCVPYIFSERFACFQTYSRDNMRGDIEGCLKRYDDLLAQFRPQIPQFEAEFDSLMPRDEKKRALRFVRHLLFMTYVECGWQPHGKPASARDAVLIDEYDRLATIPPEVTAQYVAQLPVGERLRRAYGVKSLALAQGKAESEALTSFREALLQGLREEADSFALHFNLGICEMLLGRLDEADAIFQKITEGNLRHRPEDPAPVDLLRLDSLYWINDARIRERCPETKPLVPEKDVWMSQVWGNRAEVAIRKKDYTGAAEYAEHSLDLFPYNEDVQKIYLRAAFGLALGGGKEWPDRFMQAFDAARYNDCTVLHDFAAPAFHLLMESKRSADAQKLLEDLKLYMSRVRLVARQTVLYEEFIPYMRRYGIPHARLPAGNAPNAG